MGERDRSSSSASAKCPRRSFGNWTEYFSSSGKRYFYNVKTEVSQWEKPQEWRDHDRAQLAASAASLNAQIQQPHYFQPQQQQESTPTATPSGRTTSVSAYTQRRSLEKPIAVTPQRATSALEAGKPSALSPMLTTPTSVGPESISRILTHSASLECNQEEMPMDVDEESRDGDDEEEEKPEVKREEPKQLFADDPITFNPEKYMFLPCLPPDHQIRRNLIDHYESESLRAEAKAFSIQTKIDQLSWDIKYTKSLVHNARLKAALSSKRMCYVREDLKRLEEKKPTRSSFSTLQPSSFCQPSTSQ